MKPFGLYNSKNLNNQEKTHYYIELPLRYQFIRKMEVSETIVEVEFT